ncbi:sodium:solute symporter family transporter [Kangiella shandongensis]|uniref:sodium:solute symporter family transporter n=1 Tax=Kangiella shandongensis TaxID=2763258 RepID=UPI001CBE6C04|nr:PAS domain-containing hybrid sensor histidine kinase/response regulator [Kangiella shandongensis]
MVISGWLLFTIAFAYLSLLFAIAHYGNRKVHTFSERSKAVITSLSLAVYCTSWAFFGTIQQAAETGWWFAPTYLGTLIFFAFAWPLVQKLVLSSKKHNSTSISDLLSSRYGKSHGVAILVTLIALVAVIPYIAIQLKATSDSYEFITQGLDADLTGASSFNLDSAFYIALLMGIFTILFGTRKSERYEQHSGVILAVAFESLVKLFAFIAVGLFISIYTFEGLGDFTSRIIENNQTKQSTSAAPLSYWTHVFLGVLAMFCLPRQFHVLAVEPTNIKQVNSARWLFPVYLFAINFFILPIAIAGNQFFADQSINADHYILAFPMMAEKSTLTILTFIGGLSAATSMVIIATLVISTMLTNHLIMPLLLKNQRYSSRRDLTGLILLVRSVVIMLVLLIAYSYYRSVASYTEIPSTGLLSFALVAQFSPAIIGGLYWKKANHKGAIAGLSVGALLWFYCLLLPSLHSIGLVESSLVTEGPLGIEWLKPTGLFGEHNFDVFTHGVFWSLLTNLCVYFVISKNTYSGIIDKAQANSFINVAMENISQEGTKLSEHLSIADLKAISQQFIGIRKTQQLFQQYQKHHTINKELFSQPLDQQMAPPELIKLIEHTLSGTIGSATARMVLTRFSQKQSKELEQVVEFIEESYQALEFNRELLQAAVQNLPHGISVIDHNLNLVVWNKPYVSMFNYPDELMQIGTPIIELIEYNAKREETDHEVIEQKVRRRLQTLKSGLAHSHERTDNWGKTLVVTGNPMPGGGFVTTFVDITEYKAQQESLKQLNENLEDRVQERTQDLAEANDQLAIAKKQAESANQIKTQFLTACSHDLLQPLNAANLFASSLAQFKEPESVEQSINNIQASISQAETLINDLLEIAKLDGQAIEPKLMNFDLNDLLGELASGNSMLAKDQGIQLSYVPCNATIASDPKLLRRILQNLLNNAIRHTPDGRIVLGCRYRSEGIEIQVCDNGEGISKDKQRQIFDEFRRLPTNQNAKYAGHGLGLAICQKLSKLLRHPMRLSSELHKGSIFSILVPYGSDAEKISLNSKETTRPGADTIDFQQKTIVYVDDDKQQLDAMTDLLQQWNCRVYSFSSYQSLEESFASSSKVDFIITDYHLESGNTGLDSIRFINNRLDTTVPSMIVSADSTASAIEEIRGSGYLFLKKPLKPLKLYNLLKKHL